MNDDTIKFIVDDPGGILKEPAYPGDAGLDVAVTTYASLPPHSVSQVPIGIRMAPPRGTVFTFMTRSSAVRQGIFVLPTLIDEGYRGPLFLFVLNTTGNYLDIPLGTCIAQILLLPNVMEGKHIQLVSELPVSSRGTKAFGSSGDSI